MSSSSFLSFVVDPFDVAMPMFVISDDAGDCREVSAPELSAVTCPIISYQVTTLVDVFRRLSLPLPKTLVEIKDGLRLRSGLSRDQGGESHWDVLEGIKSFVERPSDVETIRDVIETKVLQPERVQLFRLLSVVSRGLGDLCTELFYNLSRRDEKTRFLEIEVPIQQVFHARQYSGIEIDRAFAEKCRLRARDEKYTAFRDVASILNVSPTGLNFRTIGEYLAQTDASHLVEFQGYSNLIDYFEIAQRTSRFAKAFLRFIKADRDLVTLTVAVSGEERVFPTFDCFGTVTARILVANPRLQQLRKQFRGILAPDPKKHLLYLDYAQFEPGILASVAGDASFRQLYETEDLYRSLSLAIFGNRDERDVCKKIFLAYCYGMGIERIARLLAGADFSLERLVEYGNSVGRFFKAFPELENYRKSAEKRLASDGFVATAMGNRRFRQSDGPLTAKEKRWAVNQYIQGTASVIFKQAIIAIGQCFGSDSILLPMHDAVLLQYDNGQITKEDFEHQAAELMTSAFENWCPGVTPRVVSADFGTLEFSIQ
jgi:DNA polymerase I-like protein with 3'-5' exonuclease and polymerase domains